MIIKVIKCKFTKTWLNVFLLFELLKKMVSHGDQRNFRHFSKSVMVYSIFKIKIIAYCVHLVSYYCKIENIHNKSILLINTKIIM